METKDVALVGYGQIGSTLLPALQSDNYINVICGVDPKKERRARLEGRGVKSYRKIEDVPKIDVVVDCSTRGAGKLNKIIYEKLDLPAIFQSGEAMSLAHPYFPEKYQSDGNKYLRICTCSGTSIGRVLVAVEKISKPIRLTAFLAKIKSDEKMLNVNYVAGRELEKLFGIEARTTNIYLRGKTLGRDYIYAGHVQILLEDKVSENKIKHALLRGRNISIVSDSFDTLKLKKQSSDSMVIDESIRCYGKYLDLEFLCHPLLITIPENLAAIRVF